MTTSPTPTSLPFKAPLFIAGEAREASDGGEYHREDPSDARSLVTISSDGSAAEMHEAVMAARAVFDGDPSTWVANPALRRSVLLKTADLMRENAEALAHMVSLEVGMPMRQARPHVAAATDVFDFYAGYTGKSYGEAIRLPSGSQIDIFREPVGVVGMIVPWNFPLTQAARKLAPAIAVGCTMVVKPSPYTCASTFELIRFLAAAGAPAGAVNFVPGSKPEIGGALTSDPSVDKISFTGSTKVGIIVQQAAAKNMTRCGLELGGKNPFLLFEDADLDAAANSLVFGMFRNSGQACGAVTRLLVQDTVKKAFLDKVLALIKSLKVGAPLMPGVSLGPVVSKPQEQVILGYIERARSAGLSLICGGEKLTGPDYDNGYFIQPTIFDDVPPDSELAQHEVFGPVLAVIPFKTEDEAVSIANNTMYGLTSAIWTSNQPRAMRVAARVKAGTIWHNDTYQQNAEGIWGGYKMSGIGRELGPNGILEFQEVKEVFTDGTGLVMKPHYRQVLND